MQLSLNKLLNWLKKNLDMRFKFHRQLMDLKLNSMESKRMIFYINF